LFTPLSRLESQEAQKESVMVASEPTMLVALALSPRPPHPRPAAAEATRQVCATQSRRDHGKGAARRAPAPADSCDLLLGMERLALRALRQIR
jgi:hypothetical protein